MAEKTDKTYSAMTSADNDPLEVEDWVRQAELSCPTAKFEICQIGHELDLPGDIADAEMYREFLSKPRAPDTGMRIVKISGAPKAFIDQWRTVDGKLFLFDIKEEQ